MVMAVSQTATPILTNAAGQTRTLSFSSLPTAGHGVIVTVVAGVAENPTLDFTIADNQGVGNSWQKAISGVDAAAGQMAAIWRCDSIGATSGTFTITITWHAVSNNYSLVNMLEINQAIQLDKTASSSTTVAGVTTITGPTLVGTDELIVCAYTEDSSDSAHTIAADGTYTNVMNEHNSSLNVAGSGDQKIVSVNTAPTCIYTSTNTGFVDAIGVMTTFIPGTSNTLMGQACL